MSKLNSANTRNIAQYSALHKENDEYGNSSPSLEALIVRAIKSGTGKGLIEPPKDILDFGCGKSDVVFSVAEKLGISAYKYDPAIEDHSILPVASADFVINTDVLEHLDEAEVDLLLSDIRGICTDAFFNISTRVAKTVLENGENAHATVQGSDWWLLKIRAFFPNAGVIFNNGRQVMICTWTPDVALTRFAKYRFDGSRVKRLISYFL